MSISTTVAPRDQMSLSVEAPLLPRISGAIQLSVPARVKALEFTIVETPKSASLTVLSALNRMLAALMSL